MYKLIMLTFGGVVLAPAFTVAMSWSPTEPWPLSAAAPASATARPVAPLLVVVVVVVPLQQNNISLSVERQNCGNKIKQ